MTTTARYDELYNQISDEFGVEAEESSLLKSLEQTYDLQKLGGKLKQIETMLTANKVRKARLLHTLLQQEKVSDMQLTQRKEILELAQVEQEEVEFV